MENLFFESSPLARQTLDALRAHQIAVAGVADAPAGVSLALSGQYSLELLRFLAREYDAAVIEHDAGAFELFALPAGTTPSEFYAALATLASPEPEKRAKAPETAQKREACPSHADASDEMSAIVGKLRDILAAYLQTPLADLLPYKAPVSEKMLEDGVISYSFIYKRISGIAVIRKSAKSASLLIADAISELVKCKLLEDVSVSTAERVYGTSAALYRINKEA